MRNVTIVGQSFPVTEDTDPADHPSWCDQYTTALKAAFAANPSSAFPVPTASDNGKALTVVGGLPVYSDAYVKRTGDSVTGDYRFAGAISIGGAALAANSLTIQGSIGCGVAPSAGGVVYAQHTDVSNPQSCTTKGFTDATYQAKASSRELKDDIKPLPEAEALAAFDKIDPVEFVYKDDDHLVPTGMEGTRHFGFIAEDVIAAGVPGDSMTIEDRTVAVLSPNDLIAVLWAKVQSLSAEVAALKKGATS